MFIGALWALHYEQKAFDWGWKKAGFSVEKHPLDTRAGTAAVSVAMLAAITQTGFIASQPYSQMIRWVGHEREFLERLARHSPRRLGGKGVPIGFGLRPFGPKFMSASIGRKAAAKVASRFIPYVGWALFATDVYLSSKWIYDRVS